jgi:Periplasmic copper-binding protein (NosD)
VTCYLIRKKVTPKTFKLGVFSLRIILSLSLFLVIIAGLASCAEVLPIPKSELSETDIGLYTIIADTTWEGRIRITGDVYVKEGATLTIKPGTVIRFNRVEPKLEEDGGRNMVGLGSPYFPGAEIIVRGRIVAVGEKNKPIIFTSSDPTPRSGAWGAVNLLGSSGSVFEYCRISYAAAGIQDRASEAKVTRCIFTDNDIALFFKKSDFDAPCVMDIEYNTIVGNKTGIVAGDAKAVISHNDISRNRYYGIWVHEGLDAQVAYNDIKKNCYGVYLDKAEPLKISRNNIWGNEEYNMAMARKTTSGVDASDNWWGTADPLKIKGKLFDKRTDASLGLITYEPFLKEQVADTLK